MIHYNHFLLMALIVLTGLQQAAGQPFAVKPTSLQQAIKERDFVKIREMYKQNPQCLYEVFGRGYIEDSYGRLKYAITNNDRKAVLEVLQGAIDVNMPDAKHDVPLNHAIRSGNLEMVKLLVEHGAEINVNEDKCVPPFYFAVRSTLDIVKYLVEKGAKLSFRVGKDLFLESAQKNLDVFKYVLSLDIGNGTLPQAGNTALHYVENPDAVDILLAAGYDLNKKNNEGLTPLDCATQNGNYQKIKRLIAHGADYKGRHFLNQAVFNNDLEMAQKLLDEGEDINQPVSKNNCTILYALFTPDNKIPQETREKNARWLIEHGADVTRGNMSSWEGHAPSSFHAIAARGSLDLLKEVMGKFEVAKLREQYAWDLVIGSSATGNMENLLFVMKELDGSKIGRDILDEAMEVAAQSNSLEAMKLLLKHGASPNGKSPFWPPIFMAIAYGHPEAAKWLVENGADVNRQIGDRETPLMVAVKLDLHDMVEYLLEHGADVQAKSQHGLTALHYAAKTGNVTILKRLLAAGANKDVVNNMKQTPIDVAASEGNPPAFRLLLGLYDKKDRKALLDRALEQAFMHTKRNMALNILEHDETEDDAVTVVDDAALRQAVLASDAQKVKELVEKGADVNAVDGDGNSLLELAFKLRRDTESNDSTGVKKQEIIHCLIDHGAKIGNIKPTLFVSERYSVTLDEKIMDFMLKNGADINEQRSSNDGRTMVTFLAMRRYISLLKRLLEAGADVNFRKSEEVFTPLEDVIQWRWEAYNWDSWIESVKCLLEHGADVNIGQPIVYAIGQNKYDAALLMLEHCKELTNKKAHEEAMFEAIADGRLDVAQKLEKFLPKTDKTTANAEAYLRRLAFEGNVVGMQRLIDATGVDVNCKEIPDDDGDDNVNKDNEVNYGDTPLFYALEGRKLDAAMYLINHGADIKAVGNGRETLLHCAVKLDLGMVKYLVEHGLDVNAKNKAGITPLHHAIRRFAIVAYLLEHGADVNVIAADGMPLAVCASLIATEETLKALGEKGMDFKAKTKDGFTAMHAAAAANPAVVPYLRSLGLPELSEEDVKKAKKRFVSQWGDHESVNCGLHVWPHQNIQFAM